MKTILAFLVNKWGGSHLSGWNTKFGVAATRVIATSALLLVVAQSLVLASEGKYVEAAWNLNDEQTWIALAALGITKAQLGVAGKVEKDTGVTLATAKGQTALAEEIAAGTAPPAAAQTIRTAP